MKIFIVTLLVLMCSTVEAALIEEPATVAVMDFGVHQGTSEAEFEQVEIGKSATEYITVRLIKSGKFHIADKDMITEKLSAENIKTDGIIDPVSARRLGEILNVRYIIYGNVLSVSLDSEDKSHYTDNGIRVDSHKDTVKAYIVMRIMDTETGKILMASKGVGDAVTSSSDTLFITIGTFNVPIRSVHNALQEASFKAVDLLVKRLFNAPDKK